MFVGLPESKKEVEPVAFALNLSVKISDGTPHKYWELNFGELFYLDIDTDD